MKKLSYFAAPYSDADTSVVAFRMWKFEIAGARLTEKGIFWTSPLSMHYTLKHSKTMGSDWTYWEEYSKRLMARCDELIVLCLPGWDTSSGVTGEIKFAKLLGIPIKYVTISGDNTLSPFRDLPYDSQQPPSLLV